MKQWKETLITHAATLRDALDRIDQAGCQIALVVDDGRHLLGTLSDGDVRRALLKGAKLSDGVTAFMHAHPTCAKIGVSRQSILETMQRLGLNQIPVLDENDVLVGLEVVSDLLQNKERPHWVVIMAGGLGSRLMELTHETPKPMLRVGPRPLLETIVRSYASQGFRRFVFAVNYKAEQIESYFGNGSAFGIEISYLREEKRMGTAGALGLFPERPTLPFIVTNADLLTQVDYGDMIDHHDDSGADATMAVRHYEMQVPFGVVREGNGRIESIEEKPMHRFAVCAGMYVLSPQVLDLIPVNGYFDMPNLFNAICARGMHARSHWVDGYWLDIGRMHDYEKANRDFSEAFK